MAKKGLQEGEPLGTPKEKAKKKDKTPATEIMMTDATKRNETDAIPGRPSIHKGVQGTITEYVSWNDNTGYPDRVIFRPRDNGNTLTTVKYDDVQDLKDGFS